MSQGHSVWFVNLPSQTIPNPKGNTSVVSLRSGRELPQNTLQQDPRLTDAKFELGADTLMPKQVGPVPLPFPNRTLSARKSKIHEDLLKMFRKVEINIPLLDAIKQIPKYAKFLKELCVHKRGKMKGKGGVELSGIVSALTKNETATGSHQNLLKKIFSVPCTIDDCTFVNAMLDLGASINVKPMSVYKSLNVVQPLDVLEDVLVRVNKLIFPADFYVLDMEDETSGKGSSTLILGQPFLMTT
ncbi:hypothetical protein CR513_05289, partial [Mucuna pruriens]